MRENLVWLSMNRMEITMVIIWFASGDILGSVETYLETNLRLTEISRKIFVDSSNLRFDY